MSEELFVLKEILKWTKVSAYSSVETVLRAFLQNEQDRMIYSLSDGVNTVKDIKERAKAGQSRVYKVWKSGISNGTMEKRPDGKIVALFDLNDFGMSGGVTDDEEK